MLYLVYSKNSNKVKQFVPYVMLKAVVRKFSKHLRLCSRKVSVVDLNQVFLGNSHDGLMSSCSNCCLSRLKSLNLFPILYRLYFVVISMLYTAKEFLELS